MSLEYLGWNSSLEEQFRPYRFDGLLPARIAEEHKERYIIVSEQGEQTAEVTGKLRFTAQSRLDFPTVGDWVAVRSSKADELAVIIALLARKTVFLRKTVGETTEPQPVAANVDTVLIVTDVGPDFNVRRMERYLTLTYESGAEPVIVLNKADLASDVDERIIEMQKVAVGVPVLAVSAVTGAGFDELARYLASGKSSTLIGSSGVGKSTIINRLLGEERIKTKEVGEWDGRGRHTTTYRQMILLPSGGIVIDTPGMKEIQLWANEESLAGTFEDVEQLVLQCRFSDCTHNEEPGCAVRQGLQDGTIEESRYESFLKLQKELRYLEVRQNTSARLAEKMKWKKIHKKAKEILKQKYGGRR